MPLFQPIFVRYWLIRPFTHNQPFNPQKGNEYHGDTRISQEDFEEVITLWERCDLLRP